MAQTERRKPRTVTVDLAESTDEWLTTPPYTYHIAGFEFDGAFDLGFQSQDPSPAHPEVIPEPIYLAITQRIEPELDLDRVQATASEDTAPTVGWCTITSQDDRGLEATIELVDHYLE